MVPNYLTISQAADALGCTTGRIRQLLRDEHSGLRGEKVNARAWIVEKKSVEKFAKQVPSVGRPRIGKAKAG